MANSRRLLTLAAYCNFALALTHLVFMFVGASTLRFFGAPPWVITLQQQLSPWYFMVLVAMAGVLYLFAIYGLSAAGHVRRLPLLRTALVVISSIYLLRATEIILDVVVILRHPEYWRFLVFSVVALVIGLLYLAGTVGVWKDLKPQQTTQSAQSLAASSGR